MFTMKMTSLVIQVACLSSYYDFLLSVFFLLFLNNIFSTFPEPGIIAFICLGNEIVDENFALLKGYLKPFSQFVIFYKLQKFEKN